MKRAAKALLLVDVFNPLDFAGARKLAPDAVRAARNCAALAARCRRSRWPVIYANDNFGHWRSEFSRLVRECLDQPGASRDLARALQPDAEDYSVLKPRHSAFYGTPLEFLLDELEVNALILAGLSADMCISATAQDAYVRKYRLWVPADCVAADTAEHEQQALEHMARTMKAAVDPAGSGGGGWDAVRDR